MLIGFSGGMNVFSNVVTGHGIDGHFLWNNILLHLSLWGRASMLKHLSLGEIEGVNIMEQDSRQTEDGNVWNDALILK